MILDAILIHSIPANVEEEQEGTEEEQEDTGCNKQSVGKWYTGKVFYSVKDMAHVGLRRNAVLNYGTCSASEIFHEEIRKKGC